jgi:hypothetical protein
MNEKKECPACKVVGNNPLEGCPCCIPSKIVAVLNKVARLEHRVQDLETSRILKLLSDCYPFLVHAACSIPDNHPDYIKAHELMKEIDPIINQEIYSILAALPE